MRELIRMQDFTVKTYHPDQKGQLIQLYKATTAQQEEIIFWWPGEEEYTWASCYCVFAGEKMVAKGQVRPINVQDSGSNPEAKHQIYLNLKVHPEWDHDESLKDMLFEKLYERALIQKAKLPAEFETELCVGNFSTEETNNNYFIKKGFAHFNSLFWMERGLEIPTGEPGELPAGIEVRKWRMETTEEEQQYLEAERKIWPENAIGSERLHEYKSKPNWTAITAFVEGEIVGSAMAWEANSATKTGEIEDIFVMPEWRKKGIARQLLVKAIRHLQEAGLENAYLLVLTDNDSALNLYKSVGFEVTKEERRYSIPLTEPAK